MEHERFTLGERPDDERRPLQLQSLVGAWMQGGEIIDLGRREHGCREAKAWLIARLQR